MDIYGQKIVQRKEGMKLDGAFFLTIVRPIEYIEAECNNTRIKQHDTGCLDTLSEATGESLLSQPLMKQPVDIPEHQSIALCVLMTQRVAGWSFLNSQMVKSPTDSFQPFADIT